MNKHRSEKFVGNFTNTDRSYFNNNIFLVIKGPQIIFLNFEINIKYFLGTFFFFKLCLQIFQKHFGQFLKLFDKTNI